MRFLRVLLLVVMLSPLCAAAQGRHSVSLLTCGSGDELYTVFGHSALLVTDSLTGQSVIYNFGTFDFDTPNFYLKFIRGDLDYYLNMESEDWFLYVYGQEGRSVMQQKLDLPAEAVDKIIERLDFLMLPENRAYKYKFAEKNCTTELRDLVFDNAPCDTSGFGDNTILTVREYLNASLGSMPWAKLGINMLLGAGADKNITVYQSMFLPDLLAEQLTDVTCEGKPIVSDTVMLVEAPKKDNSGDWFFNMLPMIAGLLLVVISVLNRTRWLPMVLFYIAGLLGVVLTFVTLISHHTELSCNFNVLWCSPLYLTPAVLLSLGKKARTSYVANRIYRVAYILIAVSTAALFVIWFCGVQAAQPIYILFIFSLLMSLYRGLKVLGEVKSFL